MLISDWSSDVCSSDLTFRGDILVGGHRYGDRHLTQILVSLGRRHDDIGGIAGFGAGRRLGLRNRWRRGHCHADDPCRRRTIKISPGAHKRSEEHTSELQSLMRISYAVFCLKKKNNILYDTIPHYTHTRN